MIPDLSLRVDSVKEENLKLKSENQVLGQYIENLMSASSVFQSTPKISTSKSAASQQQPDSSSSKTTDSTTTTSNAASSSNSVTV